MMALHWVVLSTKIYFLVGSQSWPFLDALFELLVFFDDSKAMDVVSINPLNVIAV